MNLPHYLTITLLALTAMHTSMPFSFFSTKVPQNCTIVLYPLAQDKNLNYRLAEQLKSKLESCHSAIKVLIASDAAVKIANQNATQLFISLDIITSANAPTINLYYYTRQRFCPQMTPQPLVFYYYNDAHLFHCDQTNNWGTKISTYLAQSHYRALFTSTALLGLPYRPLAGINAPAIGFELILAPEYLDQQIANCVTPLSESIYQCIQSII